MNLHKPSMSRRITSILIDILLFAMLYCLIAYGIYSPILTHNAKYQEAQETIKEISIESGLYYLDNSNNVKPITFETGAEYEVFFREFFGNNESNQTIDEVFAKLPDYFSCNEEGVCSPIKSDEKMKEFYEENFFQMANQLLYNIDEYEKASNYITRVTNDQLYICVSVSLFVIYFIIPMCSKFGKTVGMRIMRLGLVNSKTGYTPRRLQIAFRNLMLILFEVVFSIFFMGLPAIISLGFIVFTKNNTALHDYFAVTMIANHSDYDIFDNEDQYQEALSKTTKM